MRIFLPPSLAEADRWLPQIDRLVAALVVLLAACALGWLLWRGRR